MIFYQVGETLRLNAVITDSNGNLYDPSSVKIKINKPGGTEALPLSNMMELSKGSYYYDYLIPNNLGTYKWSVTTTGFSGRITIVKNMFNVDAAI